MKTLEIGTRVQIKTDDGILTGVICPAWKNEKACFGVQYDNGSYRKFSRKTGKVYAGHACNDAVIMS